MCRYTISGAWPFLSTNISQGSVATHWWADGIFYYHLTTHLLLSLWVKEFWKSVYTKLTAKTWWHLFRTRCMPATVAAIKIGQLCYVRLCYTRTEIHTGRVACGGLLLPGKSRWVCAERPVKVEKDRHIDRRTDERTNGRTPDRYITLTATLGHVRNEDWSVAVREFQLRLNYVIVKSSRNNCETLSCLSTPYRKTLVSLAAEKIHIATVEIHPVMRGIDNFLDDTIPLIT